MFKYIFIVNGPPRCGKDTFAQFLGTLVPTWKYSSIDEIKRIARFCGYKDAKTEKDRKFLSDLKSLTTQYSDLAFKDVERVVKDFNDSNAYRILLIDIREPEEIERAVEAFGAKTIFIENKNVADVTSNASDARVRDYTYDYYVENNGDILEFHKNITRFLAQIIFDSIE